MKYCAHCEKEMRPSDYPSDGYFAHRKFCGVKCNGAALRIPDASKNCAYCSKEIRRHELARSWEFEGRKYCGLPCSRAARKGMHVFEVRFCTPIPHLWESKEYTATELAGIAGVDVQVIRYRIKMGQDPVYAKKIQWEGRRYTIKELAGLAKVSADIIRYRIKVGQDPVRGKTFRENQSLDSLSNRNDDCNDSARKRTHSKP